VAELAAFRIVSWFGAMDEPFTASETVNVKVPSFRLKSKETSVGEVVSGMKLLASTA